MTHEPTFTDQVPDPPARPDDGHKGTFGTVIVIGGCPTMPGAPALAARSALRSGAGLVKLATDPRTLAVSLAITPSATGVRLAGNAEACAEAIERADPQGRAVLAVGPGWGAHHGPDGPTDERAALLSWLLDDSANPRKIVLDADGLNVLASMNQGAHHRHGPPTHRGERVLTPHPGEFRRLAASLPSSLAIDADPTDAQQRPQAAAAMARAFGAVVVLKGQRTVVSDRSGRRVYRNDTGNPALSTAGTGDVLTGLIAGLMAQGMSAFEAACLGVWAHGTAGDVWAETHGRAGLLAPELADALPSALRSIRP